MPEATLAHFDLEGKSREELDQRRREIVARYTSSNPDDMELDDLRELAAITGVLRRRTAQAPKATKPKAIPKRTTEALLDEF